ncbi:MAG: DUF1501 domain-containing protein [Pirellulaceae bacterium]|jgi:hypothetical protein|nr:DUF1501 domain-containing protein [Pirellulaceae bacterium]
MDANIGRRQFLRTTAGLAGLSVGGAWGVARGQQGTLHHAARAQRVIFLFMHGGPSHVDTFDYKRALQANDGKPLPFERPKNIDAKPVLMKSPWKFQRHGESGLWVSELFPHVARQVDELCIVRSVYSRGQSHGQAVSMLHTGSDNLVRPSVGAWVSFGLGSQNDALPSFVAIAPSSGHGGPRNYGAAFLPAAHQATTIGRQGKLGNGEIAHLNGGELVEQRRQLELIQSLNRSRLARGGPDAQVSGAIDSLDLAFRMQQTAPRVLDLSRETTATQKLYGVDEAETENFGRQCLLARRLVEAGVRYVELSTGSVWDQHSNLVKGHQKNSLAVDKPIAGLLVDLKQRGLLEDTLVVWGGEFGRTPIVQGSNGRDHNPQGFTMWMAGGGVRRGFAYGQTDEFGYYATIDRVHMHDIHATMMHSLGLDHKRVTYRYAGRDFRLTDIYGKVVGDLFA